MGLLTSRNNQIIKRIFDVSFSAFGILMLWPLGLGLVCISSISTRSSGLFFQTRVGQYGKLIRVIKIRTMIKNDGITITLHNDSRVTPIGKLLRKYKLDELPQLINVLLGSMSFVGPRPDVPGFLDCLQGNDRRLLLLKPGITGPASLKYANEEELFSLVDDAVLYNQEVVWPDKVEINLEYLDNWSLLKDLKYIWDTLIR